MITEGLSSSDNYGSSERSIIANIKKAAEKGVGLIQIREKLLPAGLLAELSKKAVEICRKSGTGVLVNDRLDVALAVGADGVQLTADSMRVSDVRAVCSDELIIGVSTHSAKEVLEARDQNADFALFGPVFDSPAKRRYGDPQGTGKLAEVCRYVTGFPVLAVGGINKTNMGSVIECGASGYAAIRLFNQNRSDDD